MSSHEQWLGALWPVVRGALPDPPATVVELGCGRFGGFVPRLRQNGYEAMGIDPAAPEGEEYLRIEFERCELPARPDGAIACTSLHHVAHPGEVVEKLADGLTTDGVVVVVEWDWENFDAATAAWCSDRAEPGSWLERRLQGWGDSGQPWEAYFRSWAGEHGIHSTGEILRQLDQRFQRLDCERGPFLFSDLADVSESEEREAIRSGAIQALRVDYVGRRLNR